MKELTAATGEPFGTERLQYWFPPGWEEAGSGSARASRAHFAKCYQYLRSQIEKGWLPTPFLAQPDTWGDVEISGLHTLEFKSRGVSQPVPVGLILFGHGLLSRDPFADVLRGDDVKSFYTEYTQPTAAPEDEYPEWDWIQAHEAWLREKYAGLWIAVSDNAVVAFADNEVEVLKQADRLGHEGAFTFYVPTQSEWAVVVVAA